MYISPNKISAAAFLLLGLDFAFLAFGHDVFSPMWLLDVFLCVANCAQFALLVLWLRAQEGKGRLQVGPTFTVENEEVRLLVRPVMRRQEVGYEIERPDGSAASIFLNPPSLQAVTPQEDSGDEE